MREHLPGMYQRNLLKLVARALMEHHIPASSLVLEVTEDHHPCARSRTRCS